MATTNQDVHRAIVFRHRRDLGVLGQFVQQRLPTVFHLVGATALFDDGFVQIGQLFGDIVNPLRATGQLIIQFINFVIEGAVQVIELGGEVFSLFKNLLAQCNIIRRIAQFIHRIKPAVEGVRNFNPHFRQQVI